MTFTTTNLVGHRVLVEGTDRFGRTGQTVVDSTQWDDINTNVQFERATKEFEAEVEKFFAPIAAAQDKLAETMKSKLDGIETMVLKEAVEGVRPEDAIVIHLTKDSQILRILEQGDGDARLRWVNDELEITEAPAAPANVTVPSAADVTAMGTDAIGNAPAF